MTKMSYSEIVAQARLKQYIVELEATRRDLWGINEELQDKIKALERGQEDLLIQLASMGWTAPARPDTKQLALALDSI